MKQKKRQCHSLAKSITKHHSTESIQDILDRVPASCAAWQVASGEWLDIGEVPDCDWFTVSRCKGKEMEVFCPQWAFYWITQLWEYMQLKLYMIIYVCTVLKNVQRHTYGETRANHTCKIMQGSASHQRRKKGSSASWLSSSGQHASLKRNKARKFRHYVDLAAPKKWIEVANAEYCWIMLNSSLEVDESLDSASWA